MILKFLKIKKMKMIRRNKTRRNQKAQSFLLYPKDLMMILMEWMYQNCLVRI